MTAPPPPPQPARQAAPGVVRSLPALRVAIATGGASGLGHGGEVAAAAPGGDRALPALPGAGEGPLGGAGPAGRRRSGAGLPGGTGAVRAASWSVGGQGCSGFTSGYPEPSSFGVMGLSGHVSN